jgi:hypothetical protein
MVFVPFPVCSALGAVSARDRPAAAGQAAGIVPVTRPVSAGRRSSPGEARAPALFAESADEGASGMAAEAEELVIATCAGIS